MKDLLGNLLGFIYSLSMGDYFFFIGTFLLIVLFVYVIYLIKCSDLEKKEESLISEVQNDVFDIEHAKEDIEKNYKPPTIKLTTYEEEQENSAIISYEELIKNKDKLGFDYDEEYHYDVPELSVKKINLSAISKIKDNTKLEVKLMDYDKEEAFLKALKDLQNNLSH